MGGLIISNTTVARSGLTSPLAVQAGGLSGRPLCRRNTDLVRQTVGLLDGRLPVIASGGILRPKDALEKLDAGATLVQLYTGLIYAGPGLVREVVEVVARGDPSPHSSSTCRIASTSSRCSAAWTRASRSAKRVGRRDGHLDRRHHRPGVHLRHDPVHHDAGVGDLPRPVGL